MQEKVLEDFNCPDIESLINSDVYVSGYIPHRIRTVIKKGKRHLTDLGKMVYEEEVFDFLSSLHFNPNISDSVRPYCVREISNIIPAWSGLKNIFRIDPSKEDYNHDPSLPGCSGGIRLARVVKNQIWLGSLSKYLEKLFDLSFYPYTPMSVEDNNGNIKKANLWKMPLSYALARAQPICIGRKPTKNPYKAGHKMDPYLRSKRGLVLRQALSNFIESEEIDLSVA